MSWDPPSQATMIDPRSPQEAMVDGFHYMMKGYNRYSNMFVFFSTQESLVSERADARRQAEYEKTDAILSATKAVKKVRRKLDRLESYLESLTGVQK